MGKNLSTGASAMSQPTLIVSLDFELFWGMQDCVKLERYEDHVLGGRKAIGELLALCEMDGREKG